ncbi:MAG: aspartate kinase [Alphaproteobacteria bacterium GM7ARS4]|nr:aspartate kinase [Alphaproteobacteria bacterium GM7ARS4]
MHYIVHKFGGTSLQDAHKIGMAADRVVESWTAARQTHGDVKGVVVVSAMGRFTNELVGYVEACGRASYDVGEYDVVVSSGEQVTSGLMALALSCRGLSSQSLQGWQVPINTDNRHGKARILSISKEKLEDVWKEKDIVVIPGFQGVCPSGRITTLGRGGSDTTAVAMAVAVGASSCTIFTDVRGIYTADPRFIPQARRIDHIAYEEMLELASLGSKVLHARSVELAMRYHIPIHLRSTFDRERGTWIMEEESALVESPTVRAVALEDHEAKLTLLGVANRPGVACAIFKKLSERDISVDMIVQNIAEDGKTTSVTFTVSREDLAQSKKIIEQERPTINYRGFLTDDHVAKVSIVGIGMRNHAGIASRAFQALAEHNINIHVISTSEIKISLLIAKDRGTEAVHALHHAFHLEQASDHGRQ